MDLEKFYDQHVDRVYKFFYVKCLDIHLAEDLTADTFVSFLHQVKVKTVDDYKKYLYGVMRIVWVEFLKDKYRSRISTLEDMSNFVDYAEQTVEQFEQVEAPISRLNPYIDLLPPKQREVLVMRSFRDLSVKETAKELGRDSNYVKTTYHRALKTLRKLLEEPYIAQSEREVS